MGHGTQTQVEFLSSSHPGREEDGLGDLLRGSLHIDFSRASKRVGPLAQYNHDNFAIQGIVTLSMVPSFPTDFPKAPQVLLGFIPLGTKSPWRDPSLSSPAGWTGPRHRTSRAETSRARDSELGTGMSGTGPGGGGGRVPHRGLRHGLPAWHVFVKLCSDRLLSKPFERNAGREHGPAFLTFVRNQTRIKLAFARCSTGCINPTDSAASQIWGFTFA